MTADELLSAIADYRRLPLWKKRDLHQQEQRRRAANGEP